MVDHRWFILCVCLLASDRLQNCTASVVSAFVGVHTSSLLQTQRKRRCTSVEALTHSDKLDLLNKHSKLSLAPMMDCKYLELEGISSDDEYICSYYDIYIMTICKNLHNIITSIIAPLLSQRHQSTFSYHDSSYI